MDDDMTLPVGVTCGDCRLFARCNAIIGMAEDSKECDYYPVQFAPSTKKYIAALDEIERLRAVMAKILDIVEHRYEEPTDRLHDISELVNAIATEDKTA